VITLTADAPARAALATRLHLPEVIALACDFRLHRDRAGRLAATGALTARVIQEDVTTLDPFEAEVRETFALRFVPEESLPEVIDPDDPVDDIPYAGATIDLTEAMYEQLALALDPYPHGPPVS
jgi:uncharacterized metal-binding protein YceD (DUF177 family)